MQPYHDETEHVGTYMIAAFIEIVICNRIGKSNDQEVNLHIFT